MQMITQKHFFTALSRRLVYLTSGFLFFNSALIPAALALDFEDNLQELDRAVPADASGVPSDAGTAPPPETGGTTGGGGAVPGAVPDNSPAPVAEPTFNSEPSSEPAVFVEPTRRETRPPAYIPPPTEPSFTAIGFGEIKPGVLGQADTVTDDGRRYEYFEFEGRQGQPIVITLKGSEDDRADGDLSLMPYMVIFSPSCDFTTPEALPPNCIIARNDIVGGTRTLADERLRLRLPEEGKYVVAVFSDPGTEGRFSLALQRDTVIYRYEWAGELTEDAVRLDTDDSPIAYHQFSGGQGQFVNILAASPDFDAYLFLLDPDGNVITQNDDGGGNLNAFIETELPENGLYTIVVNAFGPQGRGRYRLLVY